MVLTNIHVISDFIVRQHTKTTQISQITQTTLTFLCSFQNLHLQVFKPGYFGSFGGKSGFNSLEYFFRRCGIPICFFIFLTQTEVTTVVFLYLFFIKIFFICRMKRGFISERKTIIVVFLFLLFLKQRFNSCSVN